MGNQTYYPTKTFDDDLAGLASLFKKRKWAFSGVDVAALAADAAAQRRERRDHDALAGELARVRRAFGLAQEARYQRFSSALHAARGAFRNDKAAMALLAKFKRSARRRSAPAPK